MGPGLGSQEIVGPRMLYGWFQGQKKLKPCWSSYQGLIKRGREEILKPILKVREILKDMKDQNPRIKNGRTKWGRASEVLP